MTKINKIYCFGTSLTAGGGFEFESTTYYDPYCDERGYIIGEYLKKVYSNFPNPKTQYNYSWPGQLHQILNNKNIQVINRGKQGYGNERVYREVFELIENKNFSKDETLLIIEISFLGRKEYYFNPINDYIIANYSLPNPDSNEEGIQSIGLAHSWWYDNNKEGKLVESFLNETDFKSFFLSTINLEEQFKLLRQNLTLFFSYLINENINFLISHMDTENTMLNLNDDLFHKLKTREIIYGGGDIELTTNWLNLINKNNLTILDETNSLINDNHFGYFGNKLIATSIFNHISDIIDCEKIEIKSENFLKKII